jgi:hypothetical protein
MRRVLPGPAFGEWLAAYLPQFAQRVPAALFAPVRVSDRTDPHIVHLDGLNFSRAWCLRGIAESLPVVDMRSDIARDAAAAHLAAGLDGIDAGDYVGSHWLASFAALALSPAVAA